MKDNKPILYGGGIHDETYHSGNDTCDDRKGKQDEELEISGDTAYNG